MNLAYSPYLCKDNNKVVTMATDYNGIDELLGLSTPRGGEHGDNNGVPSGPAVAVNNDHGDTAMGGDIQNREMEVPRWLSTTDVTGEFTKLTAHRFRMMCLNEETGCMNTRYA